MDPTPDPSGFVFHGSRCGSTLLAALLAALDDSLVLSEVPVVDEVLRAPVAADRRAAWLQWVLAALAEADGRPRRCFVKFDSWSVHDLPVVRAAFPGVPWVFAYRRPEQVLRSHLRMRGLQMVPGALDPSLFDLPLTSPTSLSPEEYCARVLSAIYARAAKHLDEDGLLVSYADLPEPGVERVLAHFSIVRDARERARMTSVARVDAKNPRLPFDPIRPPVSAAAHEAARRWVGAPYERLEELRRAQDRVSPGC